MRLAVFGARPGSLGGAVAGMALSLGAAEQVLTFGISGNEDVMYNATERSSVDWSYILSDFQPTDVFVTTGVNLPSNFVQDGFVGDDNSGYGGRWHSAMVESFFINTIGPLEVLRECSIIPSVHSFSAVSSNSAHIARRRSSPYCASKAALSMGLRVAARERVVPLVYGYELGLLAGTPMTAESAQRFAGPLTRMVGAEEGLDVSEVARIVIGNLMEPSIALNGVMLRLDAGEQ